MAEHLHVMVDGKWECFGIVEQLQVVGAGKRERFGMWNNSKWWSLVSGSVLVLWNNCR